MVNGWKILLGVCLLCCLLLTGAALADEQVADYAGLFTADEITRITALCDQIEEEYQVDLFVLTSYDVPNGQTTAYADDYYADHHFGFGSDEAGMLYLLDMNNRMVWLSTKGIMLDYITDSREEGIIDAGYDALGDGRYGQSVLQSLAQTERYLAQGRESGQFRYDEETGERYTELYYPPNELTEGEMLLALLAGIVVMALFVVSVKARYSLRGSTYSYDLNGLSSIKLSRNDSRFIREQVHRVKHPDPPSDHHHGGGGSGSGTHVSSSGATHGGGGRHF